MRTESDRLWSELETAWLEIPVDTGATGARSCARSAWEELPGRLDRCFRHVSSYVGQRVSDRDRLRRIVTQVLAESWGLFIAPCDEIDELRRLEAAADLQLAREPGARPNGRTPLYARERTVRAFHPDWSGTGE